MLNVLMALGTLALAPALAHTAYSSDNNPAELDSASAEALTKTQALLRDPQKRAQAAAANPQAQFVDKQTQALAGSAENTNAIYDLSADIMESLVLKTNGDPAKMKELMDQAKNDPKGFTENLTPEQRQKLKEISQKIPVSGSAPKAKP
ncbi:MAG: hypothetical protein ACJ763_19910 [Bdellovibrionia bacterium]